GKNNGRGRGGPARNRTSPAAINPIVQGHPQHRRKPDAETGNAPILRARQRRDDAAGEQNSRRRRKVGSHEQGKGEQKSGAARRSECRTGSVPVASNEQDQASQKQYVSRGIGKPASCPFDVLRQRGAEQGADRDRSESDGHCQRPVPRQEAPEQSKDQERQQQDEREI